MFSSVFNILKRKTRDYYHFKHSYTVYKRAIGLQPHYRNICIKRCGKSLFNSYDRCADQGAEITISLLTIVAVNVVSVNWYHNHFCC